GFGAWLAPTIHEQGIELRRRLPDAIDRVESWVNQRRNGVIGIVFSGLATEARLDSAATTQAPNARAGEKTAARSPAPKAGAASAAPSAGPVAGDSTALRPRERIGTRCGAGRRYFF